MMALRTLALVAVGVVAVDKAHLRRVAADTNEFGRESACKNPDRECKRNKIVPWKPDTDLVPVSFGDGSDAKLRLEIPDNEQDTWRGLMGRPLDTLKNADGGFERGMLFIYGGESCDMSFFMKDTISDLDIIYMDKNMTVVDMVEGTTCCLDNLPCKYSPCGEYVLETRKGWAAEHNIVPGSQIGLRDQANKLEFAPPSNSYRFRIC